MKNREIILDIISLIFISIKNEEYVVIKKHPHFPNLEISNDIDLLVRKKMRITNLIKNINFSNNFAIRLNNINKTHCHIDFFDKINSHLLIRIDIYSDLPSYRSFQIRNCLFNDAIKNAVIKNFNIKKNKLIKVKLLNDVYESVFRYIEYIEFFWTGSNKSWHLSYIEENANLDNKDFLKYLHYYLILKEPVEFRYLKKIYNLRYYEIIKFIKRKINYIIGR